MRIVIEVEQDHLRLPIRVCDSYKEMEIATGVRASVIRNSCYNNRLKGLNTRFEVVYIEEE